MATKIQIRNSTDEALVEACKKQTKCGECEIEWITAKGIRISPPADTVALVVNLVDNVRAIRIFETSSKKFVDMVGTENAGKLIMIPWNSAWYYSAAGSLPLGYIAETKAK